MKAFIEQTSEPNKKNVFDKKTRALLDTVTSLLTYPYPYGYILDTRSPDGEELDCYIITEKKLEAGSVVECEPIGMAEWFEDGQADHKILVKLIDEQKKVDDIVKKKIDDFATQFIANRPDKQYQPGKYSGRDEALVWVVASRVCN